MDYEESIGIPTTLMMEGGGESEVRAIPYIVQKSGEFGFKSIEIVPAQFHPFEGREAAGFLNTTFGAWERNQLKKILEPYSFVEVHGTNNIIKVPGRTAGDEKELFLPYIELMRFARDIGARLVTFHEIRRA